MKRWKIAWRKLLEGREDIEELLVLWCEAVKKLRSCNGLEFGTKDEGREYLGLYGTGGVGITTLCGVMCNYKQNDFHGKVILVEFPSNQRHYKKSSLDRLKQSIQQLAYLDEGDLNQITLESQGWKHLKELLEESPRVFLVLDNIF